MLAVSPLRRGLGFLSIMAVLAGFSAPVEAQFSWRPNERAVFSFSGDVIAIAKDPRIVYAATRSSLIAYDYTFEKWLPPSTVEDGYPAQLRPTALVYDPLDQALLLGTQSGTVHRYVIATGEWDRNELMVGAPVTALVPARDLRDDGTWIRTTAGWFVLPAGSFSPRQAGNVPAHVLARAGEAERIARDPAVASFIGNGVIDRKARRFRVTDIEPGDTPGTFWIGTAGDGMYWLDSRSMRRVSHWFGPGTLGVTALARSRDRIWIGGDGRGPRDGISVVPWDLQQWGLLESIDDAPRGEVRALDFKGAQLAVGASTGFYTFVNGEWTRQTQHDGLPTDDVLSIAAARNGWWVGTTRGLALLGDSAGATHLPGRRIHRTRMIGDTLWVASDAGLFFLRDSALVQVTGGSLGAEAMLDVVQARGSLFALSRAGIYQRTPEGWRGPVRTAALAGAGAVARLAGTADELWVAGSNGVAVLHDAVGEWTYFTAPADIPTGPVFDVLPQDERVVWLATPAGALRLEWRR